MASCYAQVSISGGSSLKPSQLTSATESSSLLRSPPTTLSLVPRKSHRNHRRLSVSAKHDDGSSRGGGGDFIAGFLLGGAVFGTLAYIYSPQLRKFILNENEAGFRLPRTSPYAGYYDEGGFLDDGLEKTKQTLNKKVKQLNSAIDDFSSWLKRDKMPKISGDKDQDVPEDEMPPNVALLHPRAEEPWGI
ncbi:hypothetical protein Tsubulata_007881 [Turnera subulata]|uniref:Uncharacterized protein n=1 Tax=Turnera subulata TaxID=218843 RepID=A0A9Q0J6D8_9ROSI|nr:hypothetical protein Tsubulata_007881 [Turnera subulata]